MKRILSIDIARGIVMVIMALDHTRDFLHVDAIAHNPTDLATTNPILFFTRWITHLCAPSFVFLSGVSAFLSLQSEEDPRSGRRFLLARGCWLVLMEFSLVNFALSFDVRFRLFLFEVIGTIGVGFILLSFLSRLSTVVLGIAGLLIVFGHDLIPAPGFLLSLLFQPGAFPITPHILFVVAYPIIPWLGIMLLGFASGKLFNMSTEKRKKTFWRIGLISLGLFLLIRGLNIYGDPVAWRAQKTPVFTILSVLNVSKYPPSLLFCLCMLGLLFGILSAVEGVSNKVTRILTVYGRTPLFYFLVHLYVIHLIMLLLAILHGYHFSDLSFGPFKQGRPLVHWGLSLPYVYLVWIGVVAFLYPLCRWFGHYKAAHREKKWLRYL